MNLIWGEPVPNSHFASGTFPTPVNPRFYIGPAGDVPRCCDIDFEIGGEIPWRSEANTFVGLCVHWPEEAASARPAPAPPASCRTDPGAMAEPSVQPGGKP
jgi:hypothetical protein